MSFDRHIKSRIAEVLTGRTLLSARRQAHAIRHRLRGGAHVVHYFHDAADPYCHLTAQVLQRFQDRYAVELRPHLISRPPPQALPDPDAFYRNAQIDAARLAHKLGLEPPQSAADVHAQAAGLGIEIADLPATKHAGDRKLAALGHYQGGTFYYAGEWYWGVDRLHYLEARLQRAGLGTPSPFLAPVPQLRTDPADAAGAEVEVFLSFRSPYSYLAFERVVDMARRHNARLTVRPVLPMLMRGLPVPKLKSSYILQDCAREARRLNVPFGRICDPLGTGVERGYALLNYAEEQERLPEFCAAFMRSVWSKGVDAATDRGLAEIVGQAGLDWSKARRGSEKTTWRNRIEVNQARLTDIGLWGVPSFRVRGQSIWGQDRLWAVEDALLGPEWK